MRSQHPQQSDLGHQPAGSPEAVGADCRRGRTCWVGWVCFGYTYCDTLKRIVRDLAIKSIVCRKYESLAPVKIARESLTQIQIVIICVPLGPRAEIWLILEAFAKLPNTQHVARY